MYLKQPNYISLKETIGMKSSSVILWFGAGLSIPAGFPSWLNLKEKLLELGFKNISVLEGNVRGQKEALLKAAELTDDFWESFDLMEKALGKTSYESALRGVFKKASTITIPDNYSKLIELPLNGIINLNIDRLATRAFTQKYKTSPIEFSGLNIHNHMYALKDPRPFILNLHGTFDERESWVFTKSELTKLSQKKEYLQTLNNCFVSHTIIFVGIGADDIAIVKHLESLEGKDFGEHYWITDKKDTETIKFCERNRILPIFYSGNNNHQELTDLIDDMVTYKAFDEFIERPVLLKDEDAPGKLRNFEDIDLNSLTENELREVLNKKAVSIISAGKPENYKAYEKFRNEHLKFINRAWFLDVNSENKLFKYTLKEEIGEGAFGQVFLAEGPDNEHVAIKLLKQDIMRKDERLQSFRRGVSSMKILSGKNVNGMIKFHDASEIPAFVAMDYISGINLREAIQKGQLQDWSSKLKILEETANILKESHHLPERVLHRDIRPPNIMLKNYWVEEEWSVVLLDFDLACYKDAYEVSIDHSGSINGFLAPEQLSKNKNFSSRNSLVDSFGFGMIIFYLLNREDPYFKQHLSSDWHNVLENIEQKNPCKQWNSLSHRLTNLIKICTADNQNERYDMSQIWGEISLLKEAYEYPDRVKSCSMLTEELCYRLAQKIGQRNAFNWDQDNNKAILKLLSGAVLTMSANDSKSSVFINFLWQNDNSYNYEKVKNRLRDNLNWSIKELLEFNFKDYSSTLRSHQISFHGDLGSNSIAGNFDLIVDKLAKIIGKFKF